jgi:carbonic anhydrase
MDARLSPAKYAGLAEGDAHVIRNAGGRASDDAIRSAHENFLSYTTAIAECSLSPMRSCAGSWPRV